MLRKLGVSRSGYRAFLSHKPSATEQHRLIVEDKIQAIYDKSHQNYGAPKITKELVNDGITISQRTVGKYMRHMGIKAQWIKPWIATTTDSDFSKELHNVLDEQFNPEHPNTVEKAKSRRQIDEPLVLHSDRGSQYVSKAYRQATEKSRLSYSHKGYPYDNACIEAFHSLIKREWLNHFKITDYTHAYSLVFEYIETFYNAVRSHSHCDYMSPDQYERAYVCPGQVFL